MKHIVLLFFVLVFSATLSGQRIIDLEVTRIHKPDSVIDSKTTYYSFTIKNNGPDDIKTTDTIAYRIYYQTTAQTVVFPSEATSYLYFPTSLLQKGDSVTITGIITVKMDVLYNQKGGACAGADIINATDKIKDEWETLPITSTNNGKCKDCLYYDPALPNVSAPEVKRRPKGEIKIYPNPAEDEVMLNLNIEQEIKEASLKITDIQGRILFEENILIGDTKNLNITKNIAQYVPGVYRIEIKTKKGLFTGKFIKL